MKIRRKTRRKSAKKRTVHRRRRKSSIIMMKNNGGVYTMSKGRKRRHSAKRHTRRHTRKNTGFSFLKRNPSGGIIDSITAGVTAAAGGVILIYASRAVSKAISKDNAKTRNLLKVAITGLSAFFLPRFIGRDVARNIVNGMTTVTVMSILQNSVGLDLSLAGDDNVNRVIDALNVSGLLEGGEGESGEVLLGEDVSPSLGVLEGEDESVFR